MARVHNPPRVGDRAVHISGRLDGRTITRVSVDGRKVWLKMPTGEAGPFNTSSYEIIRFSCDCTGALLKPGVIEHDPSCAFAEEPA